MTFGHDILSVRWFAISVHDHSSQLQSFCDLLRAKGTTTMTEDNYSACINLVNLLKEDIKLLEFVTHDARKSEIEKARERQEITTE